MTRALPRWRQLRSHSAEWHDSERHLIVSSTEQLLSLELPLRDVDVNATTIYRLSVSLSMFCLPDNIQ